MTTITCDHSVSPLLQEKLDGRKICPSCLIDQYITDIQDLQAELQRRGGIFASKTEFTANPEPLRHKDYLRMWRAIKITCYRDIELLEQLRDKFPEHAEEWAITPALVRWGNAYNETSRVPGCVYVGNGEEENNAVNSSESPDYMVEDRPDTQPSDTGSLEEVLKEVRSRVDQYLNLGSWNILDAITGIASRAATEHKTDSTVLPSSSYIRSTTEVVSKVSTTPIQPPTRSALKGNRPSTLSPARTTFSNTSTIITHPSNPSILEPHNQYTMAESARSANHFKRTSPLYQPAIWASPDGFEKDDTSCCHMTWYRYERMMKIGVWEEKELVKENRAWARIEDSNPNSNFNSNLDWIITDAQDNERYRALDTVAERIEHLEMINDEDNVERSDTSVDTEMQVVIHTSLSNGTGAEGSQWPDQQQHNDETVVGKELIFHPITCSEAASQPQKSASTRLTQNIEAVLRPDWNKQAREENSKTLQRARPAKPERILQHQQDGETKHGLTVGVGEPESER
jgi:hypothetical protein